MTRSLIYICLNKILFKKLIYSLSHFHRHLVMNVKHFNLQRICRSQLNNVLFDKELIHAKSTIPSYT